MAKCPVCGNLLNDDFGLVECAGCGASLFIEFDGQVLRRDDKGLDVPPALESPSVETPQEDHLLPDGESDMDAIPLTPAPVMVLPEETVVSPGLADLSSYANSNASSGRDGAYHYDLVISGIDSSDVRNSVKEILNDALFLWDVDPLLRSITNGELKLAQVTSIKAALIVQRLSELPVKIKWVQYALAVALLFSFPGFAWGEEKATEAAGEAAKAGDSKEKVMYGKKESKVNTLRARIQEANESFAKIIELKSKTKDSAKQQAFAEQLATIAKERNKWVKEYTELRQELLYRYPNKGQDIDKRFVPRQERTPAELENSDEIDELLTSIKKHVDKKYAPLMPKEEEAAQAVIAPSPETPSQKKKLQLIK